MAPRKKAAKKTETAKVNAEVTSTKATVVDETEVMNEEMNPVSEDTNPSIESVENTENQLADEGLGAYDRDNFSLDSLDDKYVNMQECIKALDIAFLSRKNIVLFGKGGHGKSEISLDYLRLKGIEPYVITMGSGMNQERLFGGLDLMSFQETGKLEYFVENSFMNHEVVIFEELFDAPDFVLEQLKDILSSRIFRNGSQEFPIKTKLIICCTNKKRDDFAKDDSLKALMERFPLEYEVKWDTYSRMTYDKLFEKRFGVTLPKLSFILEQFAKEKVVISPRIALTAFEILAKTEDPDALKFIAEFRTNSKLLRDSLKKFESIDKLRTINEEIANDMMPEIKALTDSLDNDPDGVSDENAKAMQKIGTKVESYLKKVDALSVPDDLVSEKSATKKQLESVKKNLSGVISSLKNLGVL